MVEQWKEQRRKERKKRQKLWYLVWRSGRLWCSKRALRLKRRAKANAQMMGETKQKMEKGWASDLPKPLSLSLSPLPPPFFLSLCHISSNPPITVMSSWERGRERLCVTGRIDGSRRREGWKERDSSPLFFFFYLLWVSLSPRPCADWSAEINSRDQMSRPGELSVVIQTVWELTCGQAAAPI